MMGMENDTRVDTSSLEIETIEKQKANDGRPLLGGPAVIKRILKWNEQEVEDEEDDEILGVDGSSAILSSYLSVAGDTSTFSTLRRYLPLFFIYSLLCVFSLLVCFFAIACCYCRRQPDDCEVQKKLHPADHLYI